MKNYFAFLLFVVTLCSCETYNSDFPVDVVSNSIPSDDLLGEWYFAGKKDGEFHLYSALDICPMNEKEYLLKLTIYDHEERTIDQVNNYRLFKSKIDTVEFINIQSLSNTDQNTYSLWKYNINIALLRSYYLGRSFDKVFNSTQEYYNYVKDNSKEFASQFDTLKQYYLDPLVFLGLLSMTTH